MAFESRQAPVWLTSTWLFFSSLLLGGQSWQRGTMALYPLPSLAFLHVYPSRALSASCTSHIQVVTVIATNCCSIRVDQGIFGLLDLLND